MKSNKNLLLSLLLLSGTALVGCNDQTSTSSAPDTGTGSELTSSEESSSPSESSEETSSSEESSSEQTSSSEESSSSEETSSSEESSSQETSSSEESTDPAPIVYDITVAAEEGVTATVNQTAEEGEVVHVTLTYDLEALTILSVKANDVVCGRDENGVYYFVMPAEDVNIAIESAPIEEVTIHSVTNTTSEIADLVGVGEEAAVGSTVTFALMMKPGFNYTGLTVEQFGFVSEVVEHETVEIEGKTYFTFVMPNGDVRITVTATRSSFALDFDSDLITNVYLTPVGETSETSCRNNIAEYGATVRVVLRNSLTEIATGIRVVETGQVVMLKDGENSVTFIMPSRDITIVPVADAYYRTLEIANSEHLTVTAYTMGEDGALEEADGKAVANETVYVQVDGVTEDIAINTLVASYPTTYYDEEIDLLEDGVDENGYYTFSMPVTDETVTIAVTEKNLTKYTGYPFVGSWIGDNIYGERTATGGSVGTTNYSFDIDGAGIFVKSGTTYTIDSATNAEGPGVANLIEGNDTEPSKVFAYSDKIIFSQYNFNNLTSNDNIWAVKKLNADDDNSLYTVDYEIFGDKHYIAIQYYRDGEPYAAGFADYSGNYLDPNYCLDATFEFTSGSKVTDATAAYKVIDNATGEALCEVGYSGAGGQDNRFVLDGLQGNYAGEKGDLVLDGTGTATIGEEVYSYTLGEDGNLTLIQGGTTIVVTLGDAVYTVVSETEAENDYIGSTFSGEFTDSDGDTYTMAIAFVDAIHAEMTINWGYTQMIPNSSWEEGAEQTYSINADTGVITLNTYDNSGNPITLTLTPGADGSLTVNEDVSWVYETSGAVLTRE